MTMNNAVRVVAGVMIVLSLLLTYWVHGAFAWLTLLIGLNLIQSAFTGICPAEMLLKRFGFHG